jgi:CRP/FNR family transcriptional regulator, cyclic AMP receptor protein
VSEVPDPTGLEETDAPPEAPVEAAPTPAEPDPKVVTSPAETLALLGRINLFTGLPSIYLKRIQALGEVEAFGTGNLIFAEGAAGDKVYLILEGKVRISRTVPGMGEEALAVLKAGDYFGEMALIDDFPRSADARVHESCRLFVISKEHLQDLLFVDRDLAYDLLWNFVRTLSGRLRETNDKMTFLAVSSRF